MGRGLMGQGMGQNMMPEQKDAGSRNGYGYRDVLRRENDVTVF